MHLLLHLLTYIYVPSNVALFALSNGFEYGYDDGYDSSYYSNDYQYLDEYNDYQYLDEYSDIYSIDFSDILLDNIFDEWLVDDLWDNIYDITTFNHQKIRQKCARDTRSHDLYCACQSFDIYHNLGIYQCANSNAMNSYANKYQHYNDYYDMMNLGDLKIDERLDTKRKPMTSAQIYGAVGPELGYKLSYHHIFPHVLLRYLWNGIIIYSSEYDDLTAYFNPVIQNIKTWMSIGLSSGDFTANDKKNVVSLISCQFEKPKDCVDWDNISPGHGNRKYQRSQRKIIHKKAWIDLQIAYEWLKGNLFVGPEPDIRSDDPGNKFEVKFKYILNNEEAFTKLQDAYDTLVAFVVLTSTRNQFKYWYSEEQNREQYEAARQNDIHFQAHRRADRTGRSTKCFKFNRKRYSYNELQQKLQNLNQQLQQITEDGTTFTQPEPATAGLNNKTKRKIRKAIRKRAKGEQLNEDETTALEGNPSLAKQNWIEWEKTRQQFEEGKSRTLELLQKQISKTQNVFNKINPNNLFKKCVKVPYFKERYFDTESIPIIPYGKLREALQTFDERSRKRITEYDPNQWSLIKLSPDGEEPEQWSAQIDVN